MKFFKEKDALKYYVAQWVVVDESGSVKFQWKVLIEKEEK